jgi:WD40 repeat protein
VTATLSGHSNALTDVGFSKDNEHVVTSSRDGTARVAKSDTGAPLILLAGHKDWVTSAAFSGGAGSRVVTASRDGTARIWDALFQPVLHELAELDSPVRYVGFTRDGVVRAESNAGTNVLDGTTGKLLSRGPLPARDAHPRRYVGPNGTIATIRGKTVLLRANGRVMTLTGHRARITSLSFSPDGARIATASLDHDVRIWDLRTGNPGPVLQHNSAVRDIQFSPDGRWMVTAASRAGLYDARDGTLVLRLQGGAGVLNAVAFDPTGRTIVTGGEDGIVRTYRCTICGGIDDLVALARARLAATGRELTAL